MSSTLKRREFLIQGTQAGMVCCGMLLCPGMAYSAWTGDVKDEEIPDPGKLEYCGYSCPDDCVLLKASLGNDAELKKQAWEQWKMQERFGIDFDADRIFCYKCKAPDQPDGIVLQNCTVRSCVIDKGFDCCIECSELAECKKDLWTRFPEFKEYVIDLQKKYRAG